MQLNSELVNKEICGAVSKYFLAVSIILSCLPSFIGAAHANKTAQEPAQYPLFMRSAATPIMMLNMSKDHQLFFKMYDDYSDITDPEGGDSDGVIDSSYNNAYKYYGYFETDLCYQYNKVENFFEPSSRLVAGYCNSQKSDEWSGNFLNWSSMTRIDIVRKILYGGLRDIDTTEQTVLRRALLPNDAHAFAKYYNGVDLAKLTPFSKVVSGKSQSVHSGITLCNTTDGGNLLSQFVTAPPLLRVAAGNFSFWASNERYQCKWRSEIARTEYGVNGNDLAVTGIYAHADSPQVQDKLGQGSAAGEFQVRVDVCNSTWSGEHCHKYPAGNLKPIGLLQEYGAHDRMHFGLMTGSYTRNRDGAVLRKAVGSIQDEINQHDGRIVVKADSSDGIISTLNLLTIFGYQFGDGEHAGIYHDNNPASHKPSHKNSHDGCYWGQSSFTNGHCTNWGNPQAEIFLESLLYLSGRHSSAALDTSKDYLPTASWNKPVTEKNYCAPLNILQFNASSTTYDGDALTGFSQLGSDLSSYTNRIASELGENLTGEYFFGGAASGDSNCTAKTFDDFSSIRGLCPDAPRGEGTYQLAGLAYFARSQDLMPELAGSQQVNTLGVALAPALPQIKVFSPNRQKSSVIIPACRNQGGNVATQCALVDFKVLEQSENTLLAPDAFDDVRSLLNGQRVNTGRLYVNWEDSEQGGDFDQDMWGLMDYWISDSHLIIRTQIVAQSTTDPMGFGFVLSGTTQDGFHVQSGIHGYRDGDCAPCQLSDAARIKIFRLGTSEAKFLQPPLYYASKWGGYGTEIDQAVERLSSAGASNAERERERMRLINLRDTTNSYMYANQPHLLRKALTSAFDRVANMTASAGRVTSVGARLSEANWIVQSQFTSDNWRGQLNFFKASDSSDPQTLMAFSTQDTQVFPANHSQRNMLIGQNNDDDFHLVPFTWDNLSNEQKRILSLSGHVRDDADVQQRILWLRGSDEAEAVTLRERGRGAARNLLGDIVNANVLVAGAQNFQWQRLPQGGSSYSAYVASKQSRQPLVVVGTNDGMLHGFSLPDNEGARLREIFAFIPKAVLPKLMRLASPDYGSSHNPHQFLMDGKITLADVYDPARAKWRTILIGTFGAGARGVFALDISDHDAPQLLWERDEQDFPGLGFVMGDISVAPLNHGRFAAIFGNGLYGAGHSQLMIVDALTGRLERALVAPEGEALATPALLTDARGLVTAAYAGDVTGRLWKFSLASDLSVRWGVDYLLLHAEAPSATGALKDQPITAAPTLGRNLTRAGKVMVYVGTGKYADTEDVGTSSAVAMSVYGILDDDVSLTRSQLYRKQLRLVTKDGLPIRVVEENESKALDWQTDRGWYFDFPSDTGERVVSKMLLAKDRLVVATIAPSAHECEAGGNSWLMDIPATGTAFQFNLRKRNPAALETPQYFSSLLLGEPHFMFGEDTGYLIGSTSDAQLIKLPAVSLAPRAGRQAWRQLK